MRLACNCKNSCRYFIDTGTRAPLYATIQIKQAHHKSYNWSMLCTGSQTIASWYFLGCHAVEHLLAFLLHFSLNFGLCNQGSHCVDKIANCHNNQQQPTGYHLFTQPKSQAISEKKRLYYPIYCMLPERKLLPVVVQCCFILMSWFVRN